MEQNKILMIFIRSKYNFKEIADKLKVSYSTVLNWKDGKTTPSKRNMVSIELNFKKEIKLYNKEHKF
jgi:predicted DNA-binding protein YlxM (UPF0122 family)